MNLQSYFAPADLGSLSVAEIAGLAPYLLGRQVAGEVIAIAVSVGRPYAVRATPLDELDDERCCGIAAAYWARTRIDRVWLIGHGTDIDEANAAIRCLAEALGRSGIQRALEANFEGSDDLAFLTESGTTSTVRAPMTGRWR